MLKHLSEKTKKKKKEMGVPAGIATKSSLQLNISIANAFCITFFCHSCNESLKSYALVEEFENYILVFIILLSSRHVKCGHE